jgi:mannan endo-1,4-beta-mannosidase
MKQKKKFLTLVFLITLVSCSENLSSQTAKNNNGTVDPLPIIPVNFQTANSNASPAAKAVLSYLAGITFAPNPGFHGVIAGQNCYHGDEISGSNPNNGFTNLVVDLYNKTGKWPGIIGVDYEYMQIFSPAQLSNCNKVLIDYWKKGGLITINMSPQNPWSYDETTNPGDYNGTRILTNVILEDLLNPAKPVYFAWRRKLDRLANALTQLRDAGVVVLWRPMQEMNGGWFWWGIDPTTDPTRYINLWQDMFNYFTTTKNLTNLLWVYSPVCSSKEGWWKPVDWAYPGSNYVDIIAGTSYNDTLLIEDYTKYLSMGKPVGMGELGPGAYGQPSLTGTFDDRKYVNRFRSNYPRIAYWVSWHDWTEWPSTNVHLSLVGNANASVLMNDPGVITLDALKETAALSNCH